MWPGVPYAVGSSVDGKVLTHDHQLYCFRL